MELRGELLKLLTLPAKPTKAEELAMRLYVAQNWRLMREQRDGIPQMIVAELAQVQQSVISELEHGYPFGISAFALRRVLAVYRALEHVNGTVRGSAELCYASSAAHGIHAGLRTNATEQGSSTGS